MKILIPRGPLDQSNKPQKSGPRRREGAAASLLVAFFPPTRKQHGEARRGFQVVSLNKICPRERAEHLGHSMHLQKRRVATTPRRQKTIHSTRAAIEDPSNRASKTSLFFAWCTDIVIITAFTCKQLYADDV